MKDFSAKSRRENWNLEAETLTNKLFSKNIFEL